VKNHKEKYGRKEVSATGYSKNGILGGGGIGGYLEGPFRGGKGLIQKRKQRKREERGEEREGGGTRTTNGFGEKKNWPMGTDVWGGRTRFRGSKSFKVSKSGSRQRGGSGDSL